MQASDGAVTYFLYRQRARLGMTGGAGAFRSRPDMDDDCLVTGLTLNNA